MKGIFEEIVSLLSAGENIAVATVVQTRGSTPREVGAKMVVRPSGAIIGTVGGGCGEAEVWRAAVEVMHSRKPRTVEVDLTQEISMQSDGVCGGIMDVFVEAWWPAQSPGGSAELEDDGTASPLGVAEAMVKAEKGRKAVALATVVGCGAGSPLGAGAKMLVLGEGSRLGGFGSAVLDELIVEEGLKAIRTGEPGIIKPASVAHMDGGEGLASQLATVEVFVQPFKSSPTLLIAGAGHIAVPLAKMAKLLDLDVAVVDDRASFANQERFPEADEIIVSDFESALGGFPVTPDTYIVLITRGHQHDVVSLKQVIDSPAAYIGMIGSRRRVFAVFKLLHDEGMPLEKLGRVYSPIGIDLAAETPAEIALSIMGEVVKVMRGGKAASLCESTRERYLRLLEKGADLG